MQIYVPSKTSEEGHFRHLLSFGLSVRQKESAECPKVSPAE